MSHKHKEAAIALRAAAQLAGHGTTGAIAEATARRQLAEHAEAVGVELARHSPLVQAFMRDNFDLRLYPLRFTQDFASKLSTFETAVKSGT